MKRRTLALLLSAALALTLAACGGDSGTSQPPASSSESPTAGSEAPVESEAPAVEIPPVEDLTGVDTSAIPGVEDGVLTVGMECTYAPYNWTRPTTPTARCPSSTIPAPTPTAMT